MSPFRDLASYKCLTIDKGTKNLQSKLYTHPNSSLSTHPKSNSKDKRLPSCSRGNAIWQGCLPCEATLAVVERCNFALHVSLPLDSNPSSNIMDWVLTNTMIHKFWIYKIRVLVKLSYFYCGRLACKIHNLGLFLMQS
jgi:hypothetical protein